MAVTEVIEYDKIKSVRQTPLEELYTSGHRTCQGCESALVMKLMVKAAGPRTIVLGSTGCMYVANTTYYTTPWVVPWMHTQLGSSGSAALGTAAGLAATLYYLIHSTLIAGGLFLLADLVARARGGRIAIDEGPRPDPQLGLAPLFLLGAVAVVGLPPLSGLVGKVALLRAAQDHPAMVWVWGGILGSSLLLLMALTRAGILLFWRGAVAAPVALGGLRQRVTTLLLASSIPLTLFGGPLLDWTQAAAAQTLDRAAYRDAVLGARPVTALRAPERQP